MSNKDTQLQESHSENAPEYNPADAKKKRKLIIWTAVPILVFAIRLFYIMHAFNW